MWGRLIARELLLMWLAHAALLLQGIGAIATAVPAATTRTIVALWRRVTKRRRRALRTGAVLFGVVKLILARCAAYERRCHEH